MTVYADRVKETTATTGTGAYVLAGAAAGFRAFSSAFAASDAVSYCVEDGTDWEISSGVFNGTTGVTRASILASSNVGAAVNWGAGTKNIFCVFPAAAINGLSPVNPADFATAAQGATADAALPKAGGTMTGTLTQAAGTITASLPAVEITQTWNNAAVPFHANKTTINRVAYLPGSTLQYWSNGVMGIAVIDAGNGVLALGSAGDSQGTLRFGTLGNLYLYGSGGQISGMWSGGTGFSALRLDSMGGFEWTAYSDDATSGTDTKISRAAAGVVEVNSGTAGQLRDIKARNTITPGVTVSSLAGATQGARSFVTDSSVAASGNFGAVVAGGGSSAVPVYYDGADWRIG